MMLTAMFRNVLLVGSVEDWNFFCVSTNFLRKFLSITSEEGVEDEVVPVGRAGESACDSSDCQDDADGSPKDDILREDSLVVLEPVVVSADCVLFNLRVSLVLVDSTLDG